jgi:hypothetical protein
LEYSLDNGYQLKTLKYNEFSQKDENNINNDEKKNKISFTPYKNQIQTSVNDVIFQMEKDLFKDLQDSLIKKN